MISTLPVAMNRSLEPPTCWIRSATMLLSCPPSLMITGPLSCPHAVVPMDRSSAIPDRNTRRAIADGAHRPLGPGADGLGPGGTGSSGMVPHAISGPERHQEILLFFRKLSENVADQEQ